MSKIAERIGKHIRELRKVRGLSQEQLAFKADINLSYLGQIERGEKSPTIDIIEKVVNALDIKFEELFSFDMENLVQETTVIDKISFHLQNRSIADQEFIYDIIKKLILWRDKNENN